MECFVFEINLTALNTRENTVTFLSIFSGSGGIVQVDLRH